VQKPTDVVTQALLPAADEAAASTTGAGMDPVAALSDTDACVHSNHSQPAAKRHKRNAQPKNRRDTHDDSIATLGVVQDLTKEQRDTLLAAAKNHFGHGQSITRSMRQEWQPTITQHNSS